MELEPKLKEVPNPKGLKPSFVSASGSFRVILPNLKGSVPYEDGEVKVVEKSVEKIKRLIHTDPFITQNGLAKATGLSVRGVERNLSQMKKMGLIRRVGPDKGGHWEVVGLK